MPSNASEYIQHHLLHWQWSPYGDTTGFWTFNVDTILISIVCGLFFLGAFYYSSQRASVHNPGRFQLLIESVVMMVDDQVTTTLGRRDTSIGALALSIFTWIWLMNFMDLIPVDLLPVIANYYGVSVFRAVPTADLSMTFALSFGAVLFINYESIKSHGIKGYLWEFVSHPFSIYLFPANIFLRLIEELSRPLSLSIRLFGNMYAGEIVFFLIALTPLHLQLVAGWMWLGLHVFVITLQSFIFMLLTIVYVSIAKKPH